LLLSVQIEELCLQETIREIESESEKSKSDEMPHLKYCHDEELASLVERKVLVKRRVLSVQVKEDDVD
jgi:hypothetical protein